MSLRGALSALTENEIDLRGVSVVSFRNNFNKIMGTPYNDRNPWEVDVWREGPLLVFSVVHLETDSRSSDEANVQTFWGFKFEQFCTEIDYHTTGIVNPNDEFAAVVRAKIGKHRLVLSAEMDCSVANEKHQQPLQGPPRMELMIELKTSRKIQNDRMKFSFERFKLLSWWIQSFLAGVPRITVGWRDDEGIIQGVQHFETMRLPKIANADIMKWDFRACLGFTSSLLDWLVPLTENGQRYTLSYRPSHGVAKGVRLTASSKECFLSPEEREHLRRLATGGPREHAQGVATPREEPKGGEPAAKRSRHANTDKVDK